MEVLFLVFTSAFGSTLHILNINNMRLKFEQTELSGEEKLIISAFHMTQNVSS